MEVFGGGGVAGRSRGGICRVVNTWVAGIVEEEEDGRCVTPPAGGRDDGKDNRVSVGEGVASSTTDEEVGNMPFIAVVPPPSRWRCCSSVTEEDADELDLRSPSEEDDGGGTIRICCVPITV
eukprot:TRINITY_DN44143_c0_g1_i1.p2 TRINITY_DN44143_c0_g1~~TRINITY_DN44143_c0_g1_i1.p2  ORF type:complete len:122 (-),score=7.34 TRINITY_DN44143_c0_g1_i1:255-620(-)